MSTKDEQAWLREYAENASEAAFRELVSRYLSLVYSVALRRVGGNRALAEDVAQKVFTDFARQGRSLPGDTMLGGWLHRHTCFVASTVLRGESRRQAREKLAAQMNTLHQEPEADWKQIAPVLDEVVDRLEPRDRDAIVLRYFEQRDLRGIGEVLGTSEDAAQKRVSRALEKLRVMLSERGVTLALMSLGTLLTQEAVAAAPTGLAERLSAGALRQAAKGAGVLAACLALFNSVGFKAALAFVTLATMLGLVGWFRTAPLPRERQSVTTSASPQTAAGAVTASTEPAPSPGPSVPAGLPEGLNAEAGGLRLTIVAADSGKPVPNVEVGSRRWEDRKFTGKNFIATRAGECLIPFLPETTVLELTTRSDGFSDTRLEWRPARGERIPTNYLVRLTRPTPIGGRVLDADDRPVAGAQVGFNHEGDPLSETRPESHLFGWIEVTTDEDGRWSINRIADEMIQRLYGGAKHSNHVNSTFLFVARDPAAETALRSQQHVFRLGRPVPIRGVVVGPEAEPISDAKILVGRRSESGRRQAVSGLDGTFLVQGCKPGKNLVTAEAAGFAVNTIEVNVVADSEPVRVTLQRGKALLLRVTDQGARPVPNANVWLETFGRGEPGGSKQPAVQAEIENRTDREGRLVWESAPDQELSFDIEAKGYMRSHDVKVRPDGQEHVITLAPALAVSGTVREAGSGEAIPKFRVVCGWPETGGGPQWSTLERFWLRFSGGTFRHVFEEPVLVAQPPRDFILKFEAEGYATAISRPIRPDEGEARIDVLLTNASDTAVTVLSPVGNPVAGADVGLVARNSQLVLVAGGFSRVMRSFSELLQTDAKGQFILPPDLSFERIMVASKDGFAAFIPSALTNEPVVRLQAWGRIEGTFRTNSQPAMGLQLQLQFAAADGSRSVRLDRSAFRVTTDARGGFTFPTAPPGRLTVVQMVPEKTPEPKVWTSFPLSDVEVQPGETAHLALGGTDRRFAVQVRWPEGMQRGPDWVVYLGLESLLRPVAGAAPDTLEAYELARRIPEATRVHMLTESADGTWSGMNIPPGRHMAFARVVSMDSARRPVFHAVGQTSIVISDEAPASTLLDLGEIVLKQPPSF